MIENESFVKFLGKLSVETGETALIESAYLKYHAQCESALNEGPIEWAKDKWNKLKDWATEEPEYTPKPQRIKQNFNAAEELNKPAQAQKPVQQAAPAPQQQQQQQQQQQPAAQKAPASKSNNPATTDDAKRKQMMEYIRSEDVRTKPAQKPVFDKACNFITKFLSVFGNREFNQIRKNNEQFKKAMHRGELFDLYISPSKEKQELFNRINNSRSKAMFCAVKIDKASINESIEHMYLTIPLQRAITEATAGNREKAVATLGAAMGIVRDYIKNHGIYDWFKYLAGKEFYDAYVSSGKKNPAQPVRPNGYK